ncbi:MAG: DUF3574 domain-containing protein [Usitatibacter sp.]
MKSSRRGFPGAFPHGRPRANGNPRAGPIVREPSYILNIVHESSAAADASITEIMKTYKEEFRQEAVLRVRSPACVSF